MSMQDAKNVSGTAGAQRPPRNVQTRMVVKATPRSHSQRLWASAGAAGIAEALTMPVDFAKVRLQLQQNSSALRYRGMMDCIVTTARTDGPGALFVGCGPALARQMGYTGLSFLLYEPIRNGLSTKGQDAGFHKKLVAGGTAGSVGIAVLNPMEVIKTQIQASKVKRPFLEVAGKIWCTSGVAGFWTGITPNIIRTFLVCAAELGTYDEAKARLVGSKTLSDGPLAHLVASGCAGWASASISTPLDVIKTRLMNQAGVKTDLSGVSRPSAPYRGMSDALWTMLSQEGYAALYKGYVPVITRKVLWCATFFMTYEYLRSP